VGIADTKYSCGCSVGYGIVDKYIMTKISWNIMDYKVPQEVVCTKYVDGMDTSVCVWYVWKIFGVVCEKYVENM
jgi:hypothetical protein